MILYEKIENLKSSLDKEQDIIDIKSIQNEIKNNGKIMDMIKNKNDFNNIDEIKKYRHLENNINYMILCINKELKIIVKEGNHESNTR